jgi:hypothetical protein
VWLLTTDKSLTGEMVSVSVAELFVSDGSLNPDGAAMDAVFDSVPVALGSMDATTTNVADPPLSSVTGAAIDPEPDAGQLDPVVAVHVQVADVTDEGMVSATVAPVTVDGPLFDATIVHVTVSPG